MAILALDQAAQKVLAARRAAEEVLDGMVVGLGTGSTATAVVAALGERVRAGLRFVGVPTSEATARQARALGIPLCALEDRPALDLDIDGADEVDGQGDLLKGLGGALLREKIVAGVAARLVIVVDGSKLVGRLGEKAPLPVEVVPFGWSHTAARVRALGGSATLRGGAHAPVLTDGGHYLLDCRFPASLDLRTLAGPLKALLGVVEHGLFIGMRPTVVVGRADGECLLRRWE